MRYFLLCCLVFNLLSCQAKPKGNAADNPYDYEKMLFEVTRKDQHFYLAVSDPYRSNDLANSFSEEMETILAADKPVYGLPYVQDHTIAYYELTRDNSPALDHFYGYPAACYASQFSQEQIDTIGHQYFEENLSEYNAFYGQMDALNHREGLLQLSLMQALPVYCSEQYQSYLTLADYQDYMVALSQSCADYTLAEMQDKAVYDQYLNTLKEAYQSGDIPALQKEIAMHLLTYQAFGSDTYLALTHAQIIAPIFSHLETNAQEDCLYVISIEHFALPGGIYEKLDQSGYTLQLVTA